jgi:hypothetical protein
MPKRRPDADHRRFLDEFECVKIPRLRAMGVVQRNALSAIVQRACAAHFLALVSDKRRRSTGARRDRQGCCEGGRDHKARIDDGG